MASRESGHFSLPRAEYAVDARLLPNSINRNVALTTQTLNPTTLVKRKTRSATLEMYSKGEREGRDQRVGTLTDILYCCHQNKLGQAHVLEESNSHVLFDVKDCFCLACRGNGKDCRYMAGYLAGLLKAAGKPKGLMVRETKCGEKPGRSCTFLASW